MIGKLTGVIDTLATDHVILDVNGVGYVIFCSGNTLRKIGNQGSNCSLLIETHVREDHFHLYGFAGKEEKETFLELTKISGVGNKMALAILSVLSPGQLGLAISAQDKNALTQAPGVGPKLASRLLTELKDKLSFDGAITSSPTTTSGTTSSEPNPTADAVSALINLGYSRMEAFSVINNIAAKNDNLSVDELIRQGLSQLASA